MTRGIAACFLIFLGLAAVTAALPAGEQKKDKEKDATKRGGTIVGVLTAKGPNWIEVKAAGEAKGRKYVPHWRGGAPDQGGGPDKKMLAVFKTLKVGSRVRITWEFEERPRVVRVEVLNSTGETKDKKGEK